MAQPAKGPSPSWLNLECFEVCHVVKPIREENNWKDPPFNRMETEAPRGAETHSELTSESVEPGPLASQPRSCFHSADAASSF